MKTSYIILFLTCISYSLVSQENGQYNFIIQSEQLNQQRTIWVSLPKFYKERQSKCHVLYLLDGDRIHSSKTIRALRDELYEAGGAIDPLIVVGIEQIERGKELNPYSPIGEHFSKFITEEVIPLIDSSFNTNPNRIIAGHSLGGNYALALWSRIPAFKSCFAFSPAIYNNDRKVISELGTFLKEKKPKGILYVNNGTKGTSETLIKKHIEQLKQVILVNKTEELYFVYKELQDYGHNFTLSVGMADALLFHFSKWSIPNTLMNEIWEMKVPAIATLDKFYQDLEAWSGFEQDRAADFLYNLASHYHNSGKTEEGLELVNYAIELEPQDPFCYFTKGLILQEKDKVRAKACFEKALQLFKPTEVFETSSAFSEYDDWHEVFIDFINALKD